MFNRRSLLVFLITVFISLGVSQSVFAGIGLFSASATCSGTDIVVQYTVNYGTTVTITWTGTSSGASGNIVVSTAGTYSYKIPGPGTFSISVGEFGVPMFTLSISCTGQNSDTVSSSGFLKLCDDGRANTNLCDPLAIYPVETDDGVGMVIYRTTRENGGVGEFEIYISAEELANLPDKVDQACTIAASEDGYVVVYLLDTGEIQVNTGPDEENKFFVFRFENFPDEPVVETYFGTDKLPIFPSCGNNTEVGQGVSGMPF